ncbi:flagellar hook-basal body protein [Enterococcus columbae]|uniref:Uncharacterized protein n=1 Tax=Enterococcus columbae DSM 7374 = ATCC 51263 TaxID=1121865 RepID=S0K657_9ENTE|nr:flagellar hook-basal body complex protein [Enterococcus columbae]EOT39992.1 hypothetical protein OMW_01781 [Enterococcus columbae DSM 7374 = ATCC 51263]EOW83977.1 hypothetical protein I568_01424 [Enterococcus columbae DSM 7374 = ATCC 51263]
MIRSLDTLYKSVHLLQKRQENSNSNIANTNTTGYKAKSLFQRTLEEVPLHNYEDGIKMDQRHEIGGFTFGNELAGAYLNAERGALKNTERLTDFALNGEGYFTIRMNNGQLAYTRNGNFIKNDQNQLLTQEGYQVLGANNQPIVMQDNVKPNFLITNFQDESALISNGDTYYTSNQPGQVIQGSVVQGYLEGSNVSVADEMVKMIQTSREFEANQKALQTVNETLDKAVNELGRV